MIVMRKRRRPIAWISAVLCGCLLFDPILLAQVVPPKSAESGEEKLVSLNFRDAPVQVVLDHYAEITGRTMIQSPGIPAVLLNLKGQDKLTESEFLIAIESVLAMNNINLVPMGEKFIKVVPSAELGTHGRDIKRHDELTDEDMVNPDSDTLQSRIVELKHLELSEIQPILEGIKHTYAKIQPLERANGLLINETAANLERMLEIIDFLDVPIETKVETRIYELVHAEAAQVASRLNELIQESQSEQNQTANRVQSRSIRGVVRPGQRTAQNQQNQAQSATAQAVAELAERGIVQGDVKIVADERTNILIVISRPENFAFFDKIVTILDKSIEPDLAVEVVALEYADAAEIAGILNDFVGAATADAQSRQAGTGAAAGAAQGDGATGSSNRATALQEFVRSRLQARQRAAGTAANQGEASDDAIGQLSENTRILSDQRTNSLLLMGRKQDIAALKNVIEELDVMLAQVLIEAVILEVNLGDNLEYGVDWLQRSFTVSNDETVGPGGGLTVSQPVLGFGGGSRLRDNTFVDGSQISRDNATDLLGPGALTYYATYFDLNLDTVIRLASRASDARILSTPVVVTTDNTQARILVGESRPVVTSTSTTAGGVARNTFQYQEIGISLDVTPRINPQNFVVMEITQTADNVGGFEIIDGNNVPIITRRELQAQIAVEDRGTIVLGGLVSSDGQHATTKVPILGDLPLLGNLFRSTIDSANRTELLVLITPYVMSTPLDVLKESKRLRDRSFADSSTWEGTWSDSALLQPGVAQADLLAPRPLDELGQPQGILSAAVDEADETVPRGVFGRREYDVAEDVLRDRTRDEELRDLIEDAETESTEEVLRRVRKSIDEEIGPLDDPPASVSLDMPNEEEEVDPAQESEAEDDAWRVLPGVSQETSEPPVESPHRAIEDILQDALKTPRVESAPPSEPDDEPELPVELPEVKPRSVAPPPVVIPSVPPPTVPEDEREEGALPPLTKSLEEPALIVPESDVSQLDIVDVEDAQPVLAEDVVYADEEPPQDVREEVHVVEETVAQKRSVLSRVAGVFGLGRKKQRVSVDDDDMVSEEPEVTVEEEVDAAVAAVLEDTPVEDVQTIETETVDTEAEASDDAEQDIIAAVGNWGGSAARIHLPAMSAPPEIARSPEGIQPVGASRTTKAREDLERALEGLEPTLSSADVDASKVETVEPPADESVVEGIGDRAGSPWVRLPTKSDGAVAPADGRSQPLVAPLSRKTAMARDSLLAVPDVPSLLGEADVEPMTSETVEDDVVERPDVMELAMAGKKVDDVDQEWRPVPATTEVAAPGTRRTVGTRIDDRVKDMAPKKMESATPHDVDTAPRTQAAVWSEDVRKTDAVGDLDKPVGMWREGQAPKKAKKKKRRGLFFRVKKDKPEPVEAPIPASQPEPFVVDAAPSEPEVDEPVVEPVEQPVVDSGPRRFSIDDDDVAELPVRKRVDEVAQPRVAAPGRSVATKQAEDPSGWKVLLPTTSSPVMKEKEVEQADDTPATVKTIVKPVEPAKADSAAKSDEVEMVAEPEKPKPAIRVRRPVKRTKAKEVVRDTKPAEKPVISARPAPVKVISETREQPPNVEASLPPVVPKVERRSSRRIVRRPGKVAAPAESVEPVAVPEKTEVDAGKLAKELTEVVGETTVDAVERPVDDAMKLSDIPKDEVASPETARGRLAAELPAPAPQRVESVPTASAGAHMDDTEAPPPLK